MRSPDVVVEFRRTRTHPPRLLASPKSRNDDDPPPRPGGVPMRLRSAWIQLDSQGITARKGRIRSWRAAG
jgi:hypothetical protein